MRGSGVLLSLLGAFGLATIIGLASRAGRSVATRRGPVFLEAGGGRRDLPLLIATPAEAAVGCPLLSTPRIKSAAAAASLGLNAAVVTFANAAQVDFALNWLHLVRRTSLGAAALVGATDDVAAAELATSGACFRLPSSVGPSEARWGSPGFAQMGRTKARLALTILEANVSLLFSDADVAIVGDPAFFLVGALRRGADLLFHTDGFGASADAVRGGSLESPAFGFGPELNTGFFLLTPAALQLAQEWDRAVAGDAAFANWKNDQQAFNALVRRGVGHASGAPGSLLRVHGGQLRLGLLPAHLFPSGHVFFIQRQNRALGVPPLAVHLTFQNCDQAGKRHRMREAGLWVVDPPVRYNPPGGLLSYSPDLPLELTRLFNASALPARNMRPTDRVVAAHFALINHQLVQLRTALALALALNRTLVLPRLLCGLETVTNFAHSGVRCRGARGCAMTLPYWCPADHVLRMHYAAGTPPSGQPPKLPLRLLEHSALRHPASPAADPRRVLRVELSGAPARRCASCGDGEYFAAEAGRTAPWAAAAHSLVLPAAPLREEGLNAVLGERARTAGLIHFESLRPGAFSFALRSGRRADDFAETLKSLGGGWCCVATTDRSPGHFWYDLLWDTPHVDRFRRRWGEDQPWRPTAGP